MYACTMPDSNISIASFSDIMSIHSDKTWYNDNIVKKQYIYSHDLLWNLSKRIYPLTKIIRSWLVERKELEISQQTYLRRGASFVHENCIALLSNAMITTHEKCTWWGFSNTQER